jgi:cation:H+ antiporter
MLTGGAEVLVRGAVQIAELAGVSERVIALTLVSAGTGLPEMATAIMAGFRKHAGVAVGNVIGSNIFNVFGILGTVALVRPIPVSHAIAGRDMWWMLGFCLVAIIPVAHRGRRISRFEGMLAVGAYLLYIVTLL